MKLLTEYLEHALQFERLAAEETNPEIKAQFEGQAAAYRKLVVERAAKYGLPPPSEPELQDVSRGKPKNDATPQRGRVMAC
jgi:hypothetical protein